MLAHHVAKLCLITHPDNLPTFNPCLPRMPVPVGGGVAHAYPMPNLFCITHWDARETLRLA